MCPSFGGLKTVNVLTQNPPVKLLFHSKKAISSLIFYLFFKHQFYGTQQIDFPMTQKKMLSLIMHSKKEKSISAGKNNMHLHLLFIENSLDFPLLLLSIFFDI